MEAPCMGRGSSVIAQCSGSFPEYHVSNLTRKIPRWSVFHHAAPGKLRHESPSAAGLEKERLESLSNGLRIGRPVATRQPNRFPTRAGPWPRKGMAMEK